MTFLSDVDIRHAVPADAAFVASTWSRSFKRSDDAGMIGDESWAAVMHAEIARVRATPGLDTLVAASRSSRALLYGWICGAPGDLVAYAYVKEDYRRQGVASRLLAALGIDPAAEFEFGCRTPIASKILRAGRLPRARYTPRRLRSPDRTFEQWHNSSSPNPTSPDA